MNRVSSSTGRLRTPSTTASRADTWLAGTSAALSMLTVAAVVLPLPSWMVTE